MKRPNVYIAISDNEQQLMIDGDLDLFDRFVKLVQGGRETEQQRADEVESRELSTAGGNHAVRR